MSLLESSLQLPDSWMSTPGPLLGVTVWCRRKSMNSRVTQAWLQIPGSLTVSTGCPIGKKWLPGLSSGSLVVSPIWDHDITHVAPGLATVGTLWVLPSASSPPGCHWAPLSRAPMVPKANTHLQVVLFLNKFLRIVRHRRENHASSCFCTFHEAEVYKYSLFCVIKVEGAFSALARWTV